MRSINEFCHIKNFPHVHVYGIAKEKILSIVFFDVRHCMKNLKEPHQGVEKNKYHSTSGATTMA